MRASKNGRKLSIATSLLQAAKDSVSFPMTIQPSQRNRLLYQHQTIKEIISPLDEAHIYAVIRRGKWTIHDQIAHLASYQPVFMGRIKTMLQQMDPSFERYAADVDPYFEHCRQESASALLETMDADRRAITQLLTNLPPTDLERSGIHATYGQMNLIAWTEFFLLHEAHHLFAIFQLANTA